MKAALLILALCGFALGADAPSPAGQAGRYQLIAAAVDSGVIESRTESQWVTRKIVLRIDTATGDTWEMIYGETPTQHVARWLKIPEK